MATMTQTMTQTSTDEFPKLKCMSTPTKSNTKSVLMPPKITAKDNRSGKSSITWHARLDFTGQDMYEIGLSIKFIRSHHYLIFKSQGSNGEYSKRTMVVPKHVSMSDVYFLKEGNFIVCESSKDPKIRKKRSDDAYFSKLIKNGIIFDSFKNNSDYERIADYENQSSKNFAQGSKSINFAEGSKSNNFAQGSKSNSFKRKGFQPKLLDVFAKTIQNPMIGPELISAMTECSNDGNANVKYTENYSWKMDIVPTDEVENEYEDAEYDDEYIEKTSLKSDTRSDFDSMPGPNTVQEETIDLDNDTDKVNEDVADN